jgi:processive 1,2-diacylglycerol beta-glucosyltransferase
LLRVPPRVLILTASVGEGHDRPALHLADQLRAECPAVEVDVVDSLPLLGRAVTLVGEAAPRLVFYRFRWLWDLGYWAFAVVPPTRVLTQRLMAKLGERGVCALLAQRDPDVVVSVYPAATEVLGRMKRAGKIDVPVLGGITDLAAMHYWASRGVDAHLVTHRESVGEVLRVAGAAAPVHTVSGFTAPEFAEPLEAAEARARLELPAEGAIVLVSGGGWGVGDVHGAVEVALLASGVARVVCLCGRNEALRRNLTRAFRDNRRVRVEGFTEVMWEWLSAGDALVHSTGGLTVLEAIMCGCPAISYGWGRGHVRLNNAAFRRHGLAQVARTKAELGEALERALGVGRTTHADAGCLPSAASFVLAAADAR